MKINLTKGKIAAVVIILLAVVYIITGITIIDDGKIGLVRPMLLGSGWVLEPGTKWVPPLLFRVTEIETANVKISSGQDFTVTDSTGRTVKLDYTFTFNISNPEKALEKIGSGDIKISVKERLEAELKKQASELCTVPEDYPFMAAAVINELKSSLPGYGLVPSSLDVKPALSGAGGLTTGTGRIPQTAADIITPYSIPTDVMARGGAEGEEALLKDIEKEVGAFDRKQPPTYYNNRGSIFYGDGRYREAEVEYKKFILLRPNSYVPFINLYHVFRKQNRWDEAFFYLEEAMKRKLPEAENFTYVMAVDFIKIDAIARARRMLELGVKYYPNDYYLNLNLGTIYVNYKKFPEAVQCYLTALKAKPDSIQAMNNLAMLYHLMGNMRLAAKYWKQSLDTNQNQPELLDFLRKLDEELKKAGKARSEGK